MDSKEIESIVSSYIQENNIDGILNIYIQCQHTEREQEILNLVYTYLTIILPVCSVSKLSKLAALFYNTVYTDAYRDIDKRIKKIISKPINTGPTGPEDIFR